LKELEEAAGAAPSRPQKPTEKSRSARVRIIEACIDGFVAAVPTQNHDAYRKHAEMAAPIFKEHCALKLVECGATMSWTER
jgi:hypothetical protein